MAHHTRSMSVFAMIGFVLLQLSDALPQLSLSILPRHNSTAGSLRRRQDSTVSSRVYGDIKEMELYVNVTVGTPPQPQLVILDTGSADLWLGASGSNCGSVSCREPGFNRTLSTTYREILNDTSGFAAIYGDQSSAFGPFGQDTVGIGSASIAEAQFGVAEKIYESDREDLSYNGILGIGYSANEFLGLFDKETGHAPTHGPKTPYPNLLEDMVNAKVIASRLYSIYLSGGSLGTNISGSVLFGGVNKAAYTGNLTTLNLLPDRKSEIVMDFTTSITEAVIHLSGEHHVIWSGEAEDISAYDSDHSVATLLDTGTGAWCLNSVDRRAVLQAFRAQRNGTLPCTRILPGDHLSLTFGGRQTIDIPVQQFVTPSGGDSCEIQIETSSNAILGLPFLRSMYTVYDLDNGQVSIAQAVANVSSPPIIVKVQAGPDGVLKAGSNVVTAVSNTWSIAPTASDTLTTHPTPTSQTTTISTSTRNTRDDSTTAAVVR